MSVQCGRDPHPTLGHLRAGVDLNWIWDELCEQFYWSKGLFGISFKWFLWIFGVWWPPWLPCGTLGAPLRSQCDPKETSKRVWGGFGFDSGVPGGPLERHFSQKVVIFSDPVLGRLLGPLFYWFFIDFWKAFWCMFWRICHKTSQQRNIDFGCYL